MTKKSKFEIAESALMRIATQKDICISYEHDSNPTEQEVAKQAIEEINAADTNEDSKIITFKEYQQKAVESKISLNKILELNPNLDDNIKRILALSYDGLGLGETGEVQGKIKKIIRDNGGIITEEHIQTIKGELSDVLWYIASACDTLGLKMEDVATYNIEKLTSRRERNTLHGSGDNR